MLALGEERAGPILERFDTEEVRDLSQAMVTLGTIEANTVEKVFVEANRRWNVPSIQVDGVLPQLRHSSAASPAVGRGLP